MKCFQFLPNIFFCARVGTEYSSLETHAIIQKGLIVDNVGQQR